MSISLEHFAVIMEPLVDVWAIPKPETRIKHYYHQFQNTPKQVLIDAVQDWIRSQDRFPTINQLAERVRIHKAKMANQEEISECGYCKGSGIVTAISTHDASAFSYRCYCDNAARVSQAIPSWFGETHKNMELLYTVSPWDSVKKNPLIYKKGLLLLQEDGSKIPESISKRIDELYSSIKPLPMKQEQDEWADCPF